MSKARFTMPGLQCEQCGLPFSLSLTGAVGRKDIERLPDPFLMTCPMCKHEATYRKSAILALVAVNRP